MLKLYTINICILFFTYTILTALTTVSNVNALIFFFTNIIVDNVSIILIITTVTTTLLCISIVDNKYFLKNNFLILIFPAFILFIVCLVYSSNIFSFFLFYELLLVPSYFLVLKTSPNRRSVQVANYFLLWTQMGSFLVLLGLCFYYKFNQNNTFMHYQNKYNLIIQILIFLGFGVKVPLWPFHFWLSKTHVEANTGFSIFLSGILVKAAVFGLYKFIYIFNNNVWLFLTITLISMVDASIKMCAQNDLKKLVAFSTIQEMALMTFLLLIPSFKNNNVLFIFIVFHTFLSGLFFWIVDCVYRRYNTRVVYNIKNLSNLTPNFSALIITSVYIFLGLPFTIKFSIELYILKVMYNFNLFVAVVIGFVINYIAAVVFFKTFIFINFGTNHILKITDLTKKEIILFLLFLTPIIFLNFI